MTVRDRFLKAQAKLKAAVAQEKKAAEDERNARERYVEWLAGEIKTWIPELEWKHPEKRGKRKVFGRIMEKDKRRELLTPLFDGTNTTGYPVEVRIGDARVYIKRAYGYEYARDGVPTYAVITMQPETAKKLGIIKATQKKDWSKIKARLEAAGITDEEAVLKVIREAEGNAEEDDR